MESTIPRLICSTTVSHFSQQHDNPFFSLPLIKHHHRVLLHATFKRCRAKLRFNSTPHTSMQQPVASKCVKEHMPQPTINLPCPLFLLPNPNNFILFLFLLNLNFPTISVTEAASSPPPRALPGQRFPHSPPNPSSAHPLGSSCWRVLPSSQKSPLHQGSNNHNLMGNFYFNSFLINVLFGPQGFD